MAEEESPQDERGYGVRGDDGQLTEAGPHAGKEAVAISADQERQWINVQQPPETRRELFFVDKDRRDPEPEGQDDDEHLRGVSQVHVEAGDDPAYTDRQ